MIVERVRRIIRGSDNAHAVGGEKSVRREIRCGQAGIGLLPDRRGIGLGDQKVDAKDTQQFQMAPVIKRIAGGVLKSPDKGQELLVSIGITGTEILCYPVGTHGAPFVVVTGQPDIGKI